MVDSFWVGDNLEDGAFIQFGYDLFTPANYCVGQWNGANCLGSSVTIGYGDARWFWEYWPNANVTDFYTGIGPANSVGPHGSWHLYQIWPNLLNGIGWNFELDGQTVSSFQIPNSVQFGSAYGSANVIRSKDPVYVTAEEVSNQPSASGNLGPVEFKDLSYYSLVLSPSLYRWFQVESLKAISGCGVLTIDCPLIPYGITIVGPNDIIAGTGQPLRSQGELLWASQLTLTVNAPSDVTITVDQSQIQGGQQISLTPGEHLLLASEYVPVSDGLRLRFDHWSDGYLYAGRNIDLTSDTTLEAVYVTQYDLTILSPPPVTGGGWYDQGTVANFSYNTMPRITNTFGLAIFQGWYDENGNLFTVSGTGSIVMNGPHTLHPGWLTLNYFFPIVLAALAAILIVRKAGRHDVNEGLVQAEQPEQIEADKESLARPGIADSSRSFPNENITDTRFITCRFCNAQVPRDQLICGKCGLPAGYL
jgi:hypothetical protein